MEREDVQRAELEFERELLGSAASDACPQGATEAAWSRFAVALGSAATLAAAERASVPAGSELLGRAPLAWAAFGALGGGAVVAVLFEVLALRGVEPAPSSLAPPGAASVATPARRPRLPEPAEPAADRDAAAANRASSVAARPSERPAPPISRAGPAASARSAPTAASGAAASALAAEIALLDEVRRAIAAAEPDRALLLLERYRREHPRGELRRESDVLAMETLSARGDRSEAARRARLFLEEYPSDPQVARVKGFAAR